jgi:hypothetical protein
MIPVNLNYETAEIREKGDVAFTGSLSLQVPRSNELKDTNWLPKELSFGGRMDVGVGERRNLSVRYENTFISYDLRQNFIELQWKIALGKHYFDPDNELKIAIGIPMQFYFYEGYQGYILNPRLYFTFFTLSKNFRFTAIPKAFVIYDYYVASHVGFPLVGFGMSFNGALSTNLDKWAIMPEVGLLGEESLSFGCGLVFKF